VDPDYLVIGANSAHLPMRSADSTNCLKTGDHETPRESVDADTIVEAASPSTDASRILLDCARPRVHISISDGGDWLDENGGGGVIGEDGMSAGDGPSLLGEEDFYTGGGHYAAAAAVAERAARTRANAASALIVSIPVPDVSRPGPGMWHSRSMSKRGNRP